MHKSIFDKLLNKSFLLFLLISYVAVLLIPLASGLSMIYTYNKELNNELYKKNHNAAETVCENVIDVIGVADFAYVSILALDDYSIMLRTKNLKGFYHEKGLNIFKQINLDNNNIGLWFIYSKSRNEVLSPIGYYDGEFFFKTYYSGTEFEYEEWTNVLCEQDGKKYFQLIKTEKTICGIISR